MLFFLCDKGNAYSPENGSKVLNAVFRTVEISFDFVYQAVIFVQKETESIIYRILKAGNRNIS